MRGASGGNGCICDREKSRRVRLTRPTNDQGEGDHISNVRGCRNLKSAHRPAGPRLWVLTGCAMLAACLAPIAQTVMAPDSALAPKRPLRVIAPGICDPEAFWSADGRTLVIASRPLEDTPPQVEAVVLRTDTWSEIGHLTLHETVMGITPDGTYLVTSSRVSGIHFRLLPTGQVAFSLPGIRDWTNIGGRALFTPDGSRVAWVVSHLASAVSDRKYGGGAHLEIWDVNTRKRAVES
jgi:hypothetical protein